MADGAITGTGPNAENVTMVKFIIQTFRVCIFVLVLSLPLFEFFDLMSVTSTIINKFVRCFCLFELGYVLSCHLFGVERRSYQMPPPPGIDLGFVFVCRRG